MVVTGVGLVCGLGNDTDPTWKSILEGKSGVRQISLFDPSSFATTIASEVKSLDPLQFVDRKLSRKVDRFILLAMVGSDRALEHSGLKIDPSNADRVGVYIGSGIGGFSTIEREHEKFVERGPRRISPFFIPAAIVNLAAGQVSIRVGARGPNLATCTACSAGAHALGESMRIIQRGDADAMIAGGSEAAITPMGVGGFAAMRALSTRNDEPERASRPFDRERDGFVVGEGAGILVLEELDCARRRGADVIAELVGYGMSGDAHHMTAPPEDGSGARRAMEAAVNDAGINCSRVDYINAHGTSTPQNDRIETLAIKRFFGSHASSLAVSSTKSMTGHLLGAAGGLEGGLTCLAIRDQVLPPTINYENPDPECDLDYVPNTPRDGRITYALSNSFGFGGTNATLVFRRFES